MKMHLSAKPLLHTELCYLVMSVCIFSTTQHSYSCKVQKQSHMTLRVKGSIFCFCDFLECHPANQWFWGTTRLLKLPYLLNIFHNKILVHSETSHPRPQQGSLKACLGSKNSQCSLWDQVIIHTYFHTLTHFLTLGIDYYNPLPKLG